MDDCEWTSSPSNKCFSDFRIVPKLTWLLLKIYLMSAFLPQDQLPTGYCLKSPAPQVNGSWSLPETLTPCTASCGSGTKQVKVTCNNPPPSGGGLPCGQNFTEIHIVSCLLDPCPSGWWHSVESFDSSIVGDFNGCWAVPSDFYGLEPENMSVRERVCVRESELKCKREGTCEWEGVKV